MGKLIAASGILMLVGIAPLCAEEFPWCVKMDVFTKNCAFTDYNECATVARNGEGVCVHNPEYKPPVAAAAPAKARKTSTKTVNPPR